MDRRCFLKRLGLGAAALVAGCNTSSPFLAGSKRPNFVFILIDDLGYKDLGCYNSYFYQTPNIDKLAAQAMKFTDAYAAAPVCSPTRASIMTGKYPATLKLTNFIGGHRKQKLIGARSRRYLPLTELTVAEALKQAGYNTGFVGKWHLGAKSQFFPQNQGFDVNVGGCGSGMPKSYFYPRWDNNPPIEAEPGTYLTDCLTNRSLQFIEQNKNKPFLLYLSYYAVHIPIEAKKKLIEKYRRKAQKLPDRGPRFKPEGDKMARQVQDHPVYAAMIDSVDQSVGRIMRRLKETGIAENTIIIFMSDNGGLSTAEGSPTSNVPLRAGKGYLYEGGIREPMIIKWPGVTKPGSICTEPVISNDFYPTMLEMAGLPLKPQQHTGGRSLVPLLREKTSIKRKALYFHFPHYGNQGGVPAAAVRCENYKLIHFYEDDHLELYNLKNDIGETQNLADEMPEKTAQLYKMLDHWRTSVNAMMPIPNPDYKSRGQT